MHKDRKTAPSIVRNWLSLVGTQCASTTKKADLEGPIILIAEELARLYEPYCFTTESASDIAMAFQFGFPTGVQIRKAIEDWRKKNPEIVKRYTKDADSGAGRRIELSDARLSDMRVADLPFADRVLLAQYDRRVREITAEGDTFWDSEDPDLKARAKIVNLASMYRSHCPGVWTILTSPPIGFKVAPEIEFLLARTEMSKADREEKARIYGQAKANLNRPPLASYDEEMNF